MYKQSIALCIFFTVCITIFDVSHFGESHNNKYESFVKNHIYICVGDSILNNESYVSPNKSVISYLSKSINMYNVSQDNARINDIIPQLNEIPPEYKTIPNISVILSVGGNNLLNTEDIDDVYKTYQYVVTYILKNYVKGDGLLYLLNLYYPYDSSIHLFYPTISTWNKLLEKFTKYPQVRIIDLSSVLTIQDDFTHVIEPSEIGGIKLVTAITNSI
jgi:hypothetical protein